MLLTDAVAPQSEAQAGLACSQAARSSALADILRAWEGRSHEQDPRPPASGALAPGAQTWGEAARVLHDAGCCFVRNAWGAVSVSADGVELDYRQLPQGPLKQAWNTLSVDEPDQDHEPDQGRPWADRP